MSESLDSELLASGPSGRLACVTANGLTPVSIASLGELIGVGTFDEICGQCGAEHYEAENGESGVWDVPRGVWQALPATESLERVAQQWIATEELRLDGWRPSDGLSVLTQLSGLLAQREEEQELWYWWSL